MQCKGSSCCTGDVSAASASFLYARIRAGGGCRGMQRGLEGTFLREIGCK